ncbi:MAG: hypothetical protein KIT22_04575, partial [Verrucomicrobiae bacterium]|nr:hypothetical protein [Verrucomicrobiae bacterium]
MRFFGLLWLLASVVVCSVWADPLPGTQPLTGTNDFAAAMVDGLSRYLDRATAASVTNRQSWWRFDTSSGEAFLRSMLLTAETNRARLREILGVVDARTPPNLRFTAPLGTNANAHPGEVGQGPGYRIFAVEWDVFRGVRGEGLLLVPEGVPKADVIAVPDCDWTPEQAVGLAPGVPAAQQFPRRFAEAGCRVLVPALVDRGSRFAGNPGVRSVKHSQRETLWRAAYQMGRHPLGYEIQTILAAADWLSQTRAAGHEAWDGKLTFDTLKQLQNPGSNRQELGIVGYGEGGLLAFYAGAVDPRFLAVGVSGAFGLTPRNAELPIYRNVWSLLDRFGDAEVTALILPRALVIEHGRYPEVVHTDENGGAPGRLWRPTSAEFTAEQERFKLPSLPVYFLTAAEDTVCDWGMAQRFYRKLAPTGGIEQELGRPPAATGTLPDAEARTLRLYRGILEDTQWLMREGEFTRREFWKRADFKSLAGFTNSAGEYRDYFRSNVIGVIPPASLPPDPRTR